MSNISAAVIESNLRKLRNPAKAKFYSRFFKTGPGEYAEGENFLGLTVPQVRQVVKKSSLLPLDQIQKLLKGEYHEYRWAATMLLNRAYLVAEKPGKKEIVDFYLKNSKSFCNWDLVDTTSPSILGDWLINHDRKVLYCLVKSKNIWERRIAIMATFAIIRQNQFEDCLKMAEILLNDEHDLIHKAVGWMLREVGNRSLKTEEEFLQKHASVMPRTMLRYAIEKFSSEKRKKYLAK